MAFSTGFGLTCMCFIMLLFLPGQEQRDLVDCCTQTSKGLIRQAVDACYIQERDLMACGTHAYIFVTVSKKTYCVNPSSWWLQDRLKKLQKRGITCKSLRQ